MNDVSPGEQWIQQASNDWNTPKPFSGFGAAGGPSTSSEAAQSEGPAAPTEVTAATTELALPASDLLDGAPGWYPDPYGVADERWWDGGAWTDHVQQRDIVRPDGIYQPDPPGLGSVTEAGAAPGGTQSTEHTAALPAVQHASPSTPAVGSTPAGWYQDPYGPAGQYRWFDGAQWGAQTQVAQSPPTSGYGYHGQPQYAQTVVVPGSAAAATAVSVSAGPNHGLHLVLTILTCGLWLPVWILVAIFGRKRVSVSTATATQAPGAVVVQSPAHHPGHHYPGQHPPQHPH